MPADPNVTAVRGDTLPGLADAPAAAGRYVLGAEIARGGMGAVYRATDTVLGREVAVKVLQERFAPDSGTARRFADEARIAGQLQHPGIPPVHDLGTLPDGRPFLAMKLIKGDTLELLLADRPDPAADRGRFVAAFEAVCQAVAYAHSRDVIHRDLKPANVMVGAFGEVQVMDWGLAKVLRPGETVADDPDRTAASTDIRSLRDSDHDATQAGSVMGTPAYMAPEQAVGAVGQVDARSDVFALGGILAAVLTGLPPFRGDTAEATRVKAAQGKLDDCFARLDGCGAEPELVALAKRCLAPGKADRPADAGEVAAAVAAFRAEAEARARQAELDRVKAEGERATAEAKADEQRKRRRVQLALAGAVVLLVAGAGGAAVWKVRDDADRRADALKREGEERDRQAKAAAEEERRAQAERERQARAADGVAALLDQAEAALRLGDIDRAAPFLNQAARRSADDATAVHAARLKGYQADLAVLRELDAIDTFRSIPVGSQYPSADVVARRWATAFAGYGIVPGDVPPAAAAARINATPVRAALIDAMDAWLFRAPADRTILLRAVLDAADPDPFRAEVRRLVAANDRAALIDLVGRPEWAAQPTGLACAFAGTEGLPVAAKRAVLTRLAGDRPNDFWLHMTLGISYPTLTPEGARERVRWFAVAAAVRPRSVPALCALGMSHFDAGDMDAAAAALRAAIRVNPGYDFGHAVLIFALRRKGDQAGLEAACREAIRLHPTQPVFHDNLGTTLRKKGDLEGAAASYRETIRLDPKYASAHNGLGLVRLAKGDAAGALAACREAVRIEPDNAGYRADLGHALLAAGDTAGAAAAFRGAIQSDPDLTTSHFGLARALEAGGDRDGAIAAYREAARLAPRDAGPHNNIGLLLVDRGDLGGAVDAYRTAIRLDPKMVAPHFNLGNALADKGDLDEAVAAFRAAIRLDPGLAAPHTGLGLVLQRKGDLDGAVAAYREAVRHKPRSPMPYNRLAILLNNRGEYGAGLRVLEEAAAGRPDWLADVQTSVRYNLACCAALAATGTGRDPAPPADRPALRRKALDYLTADLGAWKRVAAGGSGATAANTLAHWLEDTDLTSLRPGPARVAMPPGERAAWDALWDEVRATLAGLRPSLPTAPPPRAVGR